MKPSVVGTIFILSTAFFLFAGDFQKGISYYKQGQYSKAVSEFEEIVKDNEDYEPGYRVLGDSYLKLKQYQKAAQSFHKASELDDKNFVSHFGAAVAEYNLKRYQDVIATLLRGEKRASGPKQRYQVLHLRGASYYNLGRFDQAIRDLGQAISIQRGNATDLLQLGISHYQVGDLVQARAYLDQAIALDPASIEAKRFLSRISYQDALEAIKGGDHQRAVNILQSYVSQNPGDGEAWFNLGLAQLFVESIDDAQQSFLKSSQYLPDNWEVYDRLGYIYEVKESYQESLQSYRRAYELNQDTGISESIERIQERIRREQS